MIKFQGGKLINGILSPEQSREVINTQSRYSILILSDEQIKDAKNIAKDAYLPLEGFLGKR